MRDIGLLVQTACLWEVTARKVGNVHRYRDFADLTFLDFALSAAAIGPVLAGAGRRRLGQTVLECIQATRRVARSNTNLGMVLLLAPLAAVPEGLALRAGVGTVLAELNQEDAGLVYQAIRLAQPGGMGEVDQQDIKDAPTMGLREAMKLAEERDRIARQYVTDFTDVFDEVVPALERGLQETEALEGAIIQAQLQLLARFPDTLIGASGARAMPRKCAGAPGTCCAKAGRSSAPAGWPIWSWTHGCGPRAGNATRAPRPTCSPPASLFCSAKGRSLCRWNIRGTSRQACRDRGAGIGGGRGTAYLRKGRATHRDAVPELAPC